MWSLRISVSGLSENDGLLTANSFVDLSPITTETRVVRRFNTATIQGVTYLQFTFGDGQALNQHWQIDELAVEAMHHEIK